MNFISYTTDGTTRGMRDVAMSNVSIEMAAAVAVACGHEQNTQITRQTPTARELTAEEAACDYLANPESYTVVRFNPHMQSVGWRKP